MAAGCCWLHGISLGVAATGSKLLPGTGVEARPGSRWLMQRPASAARVANSWQSHLPGALPEHWLQRWLPAAAVQQPAGVQGMDCLVCCELLHAPLPGVHLALQSSGLGAITGDALIRRQRRCWLQQMPAVRPLCCSRQAQPERCLGVP